jgi:hypothetical protein
MVTKHISIAIFNRKPIPRQPKSITLTIEWSKNVLDGI